MYWDNKWTINTYYKSEVAFYIYFLNQVGDSTEGKTYYNKQFFLTQSPFHMGLHEVYWMSEILTLSGIRTWDFAVRHLRNWAIALCTFRQIKLNYSQFFQNVIKRTIKSVKTIQKTIDYTLISRNRLQLQIARTIH